LEKRLIAALLLSFLVLTVWNLYFRPPPPKPEAQPQTSAPAVTQPNAPAPRDVRPAIGETVGEGDERTLELQIGQPGEVGSYYAKFSNRGARCSSSSSATSTTASA
jgi:hypothetical protein